MELAKAADIHSIIIGGELRTNIYSCVGYLAEQVLGNLFFDKGFISANHFTVERGFSIAFRIGYGFTLISLSPAVK